MLNGGPISWSVSLQQTTSSSPAESEYKALHQATLEVIWLRILLDEMGYAQQQSTTILDDSTAAMNATKNPVDHSKFKHIDTKYHVIRDYIEAKQIDVTWVSGEENLADLFTKPLPSLAIQVSARQDGHHSQNSQENKEVELEEGEERGGITQNKCVPTLKCAIEGHSTVPNILRCCETVPT
jgi:hypothetical protein